MPVTTGIASIINQLYPSNPMVVDKPLWKWMVAHLEVNAVVTREKLRLPP
jgi:hypothetical protein